MDFVHLHVHSQYSVLDGATRVPDLLKMAATHGMTHLALTDHGNLFGAYEFYKTSKDAGVRPILGMEAYISPTRRGDKTMGGIETAAYHLLLLAMNAEGWSNLVKLSSRAYIEGFYYRPRVDRELLRELNSGLICCSACLKGEISAALLAGDPVKAERIAREYLDIFGRDRFYLEIMNHGMEEQARVNPLLVELASRIGVGVVGTNDVHFLGREDWAAHDIFTCISTGKTFGDADRLKYSTEVYLKSGAEMEQALSAWPESIAATTRIAAMTDLKLDFSQKHLPGFRTPEGMTPHAYLSDKAWKGLRERFHGKIPQEYSRRLEWELGVIEKKGYSSYFLIIGDCVDFAKSSNIPIAPRGSGVATLLGYSLGIADVDPLRYGLLFERFTDPQRQEDPDIDLDICQDGRAKVIQHVREKYGHVAQIVTYGTLKARAVIRDVGRVMGMPLADVDKIAKLVPEGPKVTLSEAIEDDPDLRRLYRSDPQVAGLIDRSLRLEGLVRNVGVHAAGIVICDEPLENFLPLYRQADSTEAVTQWDGNTCGKVGMMKMDFLGLRTLTIIQRARELVRGRTGEDIDPEGIPLDDQRVYDLFRRGETDGVFQFESDGMKNVLVQMKPNRIEDLIAANAMFRPGPMELIPAYCNRKNGMEPVPAVHKLVDGLLAETYGIMVYQEQVMQVMNILGKIPLNRALTGIKAISKKMPEVLMAEKEPFIRGAAENGVSAERAGELFDLIRRFAGYGFNKAHSTRYAIVAYQTAFFKVHFPREFIAATLTYESQDRDKVVQYMAEAQRMGVKIGSPDINTCDSDFTVDGDHVRFGLAAVKGVGARAVEAVMQARKNGGAFRNLYHFCRSVDLRAVNKSTVEALIKCGAFDHAGGGHRAALLAAMENAIQAGQRHAQEMRCGQISLFERGSADSGDDDRIPDVPEWSREQIRGAERECLGYYVSSHPLQEYLREINDLNVPRKFTIASAAAFGDRKPVACSCLISQVRTTVTKKGKTAGSKMAILAVEDLTGKCDAVLFPETYEKYSALMVEDSQVYIEGMLQLRNDKPGIAVSRLIPLRDAIASVTNGVTVRCPGCGIDDAMLQGLRDVFGRHRGTCPVAIQFRMSDASTETVTVKTEKQWHVKPSRSLVKELEDIVGPRNVSLRPGGGPRNGGYASGQGSHC